MRLPVLAANFALSLDGKVVPRGEGGSGFVSPADLERTLELRAASDAILIGSGALQAGDPSLRLSSRRLREARLRAGKSSEPLRVVFSDGGTLPEKLGVFRGGGPVLVFAAAMSASTRRKLEKVAQVRIVSRGGKVAVRPALAVLARDYGVRSALCEGGAELFRALVGAGLVRRLHLTIAPVVIGGAEAPTLLGPARTGLLPRSIALQLESFRRAGGEVFASYRFPKAKSSQ